MKKLEILAIHPNAVNRKISACINGELQPQNEVINESSFEVYMYPESDEDKLFLKVGKYEVIINPRNDDEYKSINGTEYINCKTNNGTISLNILKIQEV